jgi:hypothetical protein
MKPSICPHCKAKGVRQSDRRVIDGVTLVFDYCGLCGKNAYSKPLVLDEAVVEPEKVTAIDDYR